MAVIYTLETLIEIIAVSFVVWGLFHEDRFVAFENRLFSNIRRKKLKVINSTSKTRSEF